MPGYTALAVKITKDSNDSAKSDSVDPVLAAQLAVLVADDVDSVLANNIGEHADTVKTLSGYSNVSIGSEASVSLNSNDVSNSVGSSSSRKSNVVYTSIEGDDINNVAAKFNIKADTLRWANNIEGDSIKTGSELVILPVNGVLHKVVGSDNLQELAKKYKVSEDAIINYNSIADRKLTEGQELVIPDGVKPSKAEEQAEAAKKVKSSYQATNVTVNNLASSGYVVDGTNTYSYGYCTWHAANRRAAAGRPIPNRWGNAISWASGARASGYAVDGNPQAGDVLYHKYQGGAGHVAYVESVNADGSILVSDMNYNGGWGRVSYRTVTQDQFNQYLFIH